MTDGSDDGRNRHREDDADTGERDGRREDPLAAEEHGFRPADLQDAPPEDDSDRTDGAGRADASGTDSADSADSTDGPDRDDGAGVDGTADSPMGDLAREVERRKRDREAAVDEESEPFEDVDVGDLDEEAVWDALSDAEAEADATSDPDVGATGPLGEASDVERVPRDDPGAVRPDHVVPKREYCQRCTYLSAPPRVACGHEGTDIVEVVDAEHFRVRGCPMVDRDGKPNGSE